MEKSSSWLPARIDRETVVEMFYPFEETCWKWSLSPQIGVTIDHWVNKSKNTPIVNILHNEH